MCEFHRPLFKITSAWAFSPFIRTVQEARINRQDSGIKKKRRRNGPESWNGS